MAVNPSERQLAELARLAGSDADGPLVMLNLNRYRERARYLVEPPGGESPEVSGREAYARYGIVAWQTITRLGGAIVWSTQATVSVVGEEEERYDEVVAVRYPSAAAFLELVADPRILEAAVHREAGLERALVIRCEDSGAGPLKGI
jgi:uncharacterized protein (DUF1330 family)